MSMRGVGFMNLMSLDHTYFNVAIAHISFITKCPLHYPSCNILLTPILETVNTTRREGL